MLLLICERYVTLNSLSMRVPFTMLDYSMLDDFLLKALLVFRLIKTSLNPISKKLASKAKQLCQFSFLNVIKEWKYFDLD